MFFQLFLTHEHTRQVEIYEIPALSHNPLIELLSSGSHSYQAQPGSGTTFPPLSTIQTSFPSNDKFTNILALHDRLSTLPSAPSAAISCTPDYASEHLNSTNTSINYAFQIHPLVHAAIHLKLRNTTSFIALHTIIFDKRFSRNYPQFSILTFELCQHPNNLRCYFMASYSTRAADERWQAVSRNT